jgi:hypothetical protein
VNVIIPGAGGVQHLVRLMGSARALEVLLSADDYDAETSREGYIDVYCPSWRSGKVALKCVQMHTPVDRESRYTVVNGTFSAAPSLPSRSHRLDVKTRHEP